MSPCHIPPVRSTFLSSSSSVNKIQRRGRFKSFQMLFLKMHLCHLYGYPVASHRRPFSLCRWTHSPRMYEAQPRAHLWNNGNSDKRQEPRDAVTTDLSGRAVSCRRAGGTELVCCPPLKSDPPGPTPQPWGDEGHARDTPAVPQNKGRKEKDDGDF